MRPSWQLISVKAYSKDSLDPFIFNKLVNLNFFLGSVEFYLGSSDILYPDKSALRCIGSLRVLGQF